MNWYLEPKMRIVGALLMALLLANASACRQTDGGLQPREIIIATGGWGGAYYPLGAELAKIYTEKIPSIKARALPTVASVFNVQAVQEQRAHVGFSQGDVAYVAYRWGTRGDHRPYNRLRAIAMLYVNAVHIVTVAKSGIHRVADMRGRRIGVGAQESGTEVAARIIIEAHGLKYSDVSPAFLSFSETAGRIQTHALDAGFLVSSYPVAALASADISGALRLVPVEREAIDRIRVQYPFFRPMVIPRGTYLNQTSDVPTVGVDNLLVCQESLPEQLVYEMTRAMFQSLDALGQVHAAARSIDVEIAPATPIPLHAGAARYYRERELTQ